MKKSPAGFSPAMYVLFALMLLSVLLLCLCAGSVALPFPGTLTALWNALWGLPLPPGVSRAILFSVRLPRVLCVALTGAALSLCGAAMQGLLRNPLADGTTLGVSSGASLGAVLALAFGVTLPGLPQGGVTALAMVFAFLSLGLILLLAYALDKTLATHTIILLGVIFTMFASSIISLMTVFAGDKVRSITFWAMGSLASANAEQALLLFAALLLGGGVILGCGRELNALAVGEENARNIGVSVRRVKLTVLISVSVLIGVCVSIGGSIGFVGLVIPHMTRMVVGPNHKRLLPASLFLGSVFLLLCDLVSRTLFSPLELPIGVVTSLVGAIAFVLIFYRSRKGARAC